MIGDLFRVSQSSALMVAQQVINTSALEVMSSIYDRMAVREMVYWLKTETDKRTSDSSQDYTPTRARKEL